MIRLPLDAVRFLTVIPTGRASGEPDPGPATAWFPVVGLAIGAALLPLTWLPVPPAVQAALVLAAWTLVTGAFHEDGWIDCMDAAFAPVDLERRHAILKDPRVGAHGLVAAIVLTLVRFAALTAVPGVAIVVAATTGRWAMVGSLRWFPPARSTGLGATVGARPRFGRATFATLAIVALLAWVTGTLRPALALAVGAAAAWALGAALSRRFGGLTGDGHGAVGLVTETAVLLAWVPYGAGP